MIILFGLITILSQETELFEEDIAFSKAFIAPEVFYDLLNNPLDINTADNKDLLQIPYLTPIVTKEILNYRRRKGNFTKIEELQLVEGMSAQLFDRIRPFLVVKSKPIKKKVEMRIRVLDDSFALNNRIEDRSISNRVKVNYGKFDLVFLTDKDAFELSLFDFYSFGIAYSNKQEQLLIGNYLPGFGQGLVFSKPYYSYLTTKSFGSFQTQEFNPLTSALEDFSLFGLAYSRDFKNFSLAGYLSANHLDAQLDSNGLVKKISYTGKHTDSAALINKDKLREDLIGTRIGYKKADWNLNVSCYHNRYNHDFAPADSTNSFYGNRLTVFGIDGSGVLGNYYLQSEIAYSLGYGFGVNFGLVGDWKPLRVSLNLFRTQRNFYSPHSRSYSLTNKKANLGGNFNLRYDFSRFRVFLYSSTKTDLVVDSLPAKIETGVERKEGRLKIRISYKRTLKDDISKSQGTRLDLNYDFTRNFNLGFRFEDRQNFTKPGRGILFRLSGDFNYHSLDYDGRIYWFEVTSSDSRVYAYEPGLSGLGGNQSFVDKGIRHYSCVSYKMKSVKAGLRIGLTRIAKVLIDFGTQIEIRL